MLALAGCDVKAEFHDARLDSTNWSRWGGPVVTSSEYHGTALWQFRTNNDTGLVQARRDQVAAGGGYK